MLERRRAYYAAHKEAICAAREGYRKTNRDYAREYGREDYRRNKERMLEYGRKYREARKAQFPAGG